MINFATDQPLGEAIGSMDRRTPIGSMMTSAEWERAPLEIRDRSFWMAKVLNERVLAEAQRRLLQAIKQQRDAAEAGGRVMERGRFVLEMQDILRQVGYQPDPAKKGTLQDISSSRRLSLVWDMNLAQARGYATWKAQQEKGALYRAPAQELVRVMNRRERRLWPRIWAALGGKFYGKPGRDYPEAPGRMIALVNDPIWSAISQFGTPWPPFRWGSGMGLRSIFRREALSLRATDGTPLLPEDAPPQLPQAMPQGFNTGLRISVRGVQDAGIERLRSEFGDAVRFDGTIASYQRDLSPANEHREEPVEVELRNRARAAFQRGEKALESGGRERLPEEAAREVLVSAAAVQVGRKRLYYDDHGADAEAAAELLKQTVDRRVRVEVIDGHVLAWRPDLLDLTPEQILAMSTGDLPVNGKLLGYGAESPGAIPRTQVIIRDGEGNVVFGFHAPFRDAKAFGQARLRDWTDATGEDYTLTLIPMEGGAN